MKEKHYRSSQKMNEGKRTQLKKMLNIHMWIVD